MTTIYCFSGSGHSLAVSRILSQILECEIIMINNVNHTTNSDTAVIVFPVYCQNIPDPVKKFMARLKSKHIALIATYGKISYGNVLYEAKQILQGEVIAGAYIPIGHTFLDGDFDFDSEILTTIAKRINEPIKATIPKAKKSPLANIFPGLRSRIGVRIIKDENCNNCGLCEKNCPVGAIHGGNTNSQCIRCMHCVTNCPVKALHYKNSWILRKYLNSYYNDEYVLYL